MKLNKMKYLKLSMITICMIAVVSCGNDDDGTGTTNTGIQLQDPFILSLDENPAIGQSIGNINASSSSPLSFSILEQQFTNAIAINSSTGEVTVRDASFFDFETNLFCPNSANSLQKIGSTILNMSSCSTKDISISN